MGKDRRITNGTRCSRQQPQGNQWLEDVGFPQGQLPLIEAEGLNKCEEFVFRVPFGGKGHRKGKGKTANKAQA
jgi:dsRNA-specific ribonuclease